MSTMTKTELTRIGINGAEPLTSKSALWDARHKFIETYGYEPEQLRVSPHSFADLRAFAERYEYPFGFDVKIDQDMKGQEWMVCHEETTVYAL